LNASGKLLDMSLRIHEIAESGDLILNPSPTKN